MPAITPNLWFETEGEEAANHPVAIFPNSSIDNVTHYGAADPREAGSVLTVDFTLDGTKFTAINGGPEFSFDEASRSSSRARTKVRSTTTGPNRALCA